jgi:O-antigen/teichoic acid export membrane protein
MEAGFSPCISRFASFYFAGARHVPRLGMQGEPARPDAEPNLPALAGLVHMARRLYRYFAFGSLIFMTVMGSGWMAWKFGSVFLRPDVLSAYGLYAAGIAMMMAGFFWADLLFGVQQVRESYRNTIGALILNYVATIASFMCGLGLLSLALGQVIMSLLPRWLARKKFLEILPIGKVATTQKTHVRDLWPMCWRSSLSAFGAYLLLRNMTLVSADVLDLHTTASLGLCLQFCFALSGISQIWLVVKYPAVSALRVKNDSAALKKLVLRRMPLCLLTFAVGSVGILAFGPLAIHLMGSRTPLLPLPMFALLLLVTGLDLFMGLNTSLLVTENRASFLVPFFVSGVATLVIGYVLGRFWGIMGIILAPALVQICWNYWWTPLTCWKSLSLKTPSQIAAT